MTRAKLLMIGLGLALLAVLAAPASAQDGPTLTSDVTNVEAAGDHEFTITGSGWTAAPPIFVVPCAGATTLDEMFAAGIEACDLQTIESVIPEDGAFEVIVTYSVPAEGMCISASDTAISEATALCITVGAAEEAAAEDAPAEDEPAEEAPVEEEQLADTGIESGLLAIIGLAVVAAGAITVGYTRRFA